MSKEKDVEQPAAKIKKRKVISDLELKNFMRAGNPMHPKATGHFPGLAWSLTENGTASWVYRYRFGGRLKEVTLGNYPDMPIKAAVKAATDASLKVKDGIDPALEKARGKVTRAADKTLAELARDYMRVTFPGYRKTTIRQAKDIIENEIIPRLGRLPAREITGADIVAVIKTVGEKRKYQTAVRTRTAIEKIVLHGVALHIIPQNICPDGKTIKALFGNEPKPQREKISLSEDELRALLSAMNHSSNADAVRILLSTAVRVKELVEAPWSEIDLDKAKWIIPEDRKKESRLFECPLSPFAMAAFRRLHETANGSPWVLPARYRHSANPYISDCTLRVFLDNQVKRSPEPIRRFMPHDCRRTARTHLSILGIDDRIGERCLSHATGTQIERLYNHDKQTTAIRNAFNP